MEYQEGAGAREYLRTRGISEETARAFMLGFAPARPANLAAVMAKRGMTEAAVKIGLVKRYDGRAPYDMFRARLMFPIRDAQGRVNGFSGRVLDASLPKYINSPESPIYSKARAVYGINEARQTIAKNDRAIVVEGNIDVIALWQAGFKETVAPLGTALTVDQLRLLARYTHNIFACFDGDAAGRKASLRALEVFLGAGLLGRGVFIPTGLDPDTLVRDRGAQAFSELIESCRIAGRLFPARTGGRGGGLGERTGAGGGAGRGNSADDRESVRVRSAGAQGRRFPRRERRVIAQGSAEGTRGQSSAAPRGRITGSKGGTADEQRGRGRTSRIGLVAIALNYPDLRTEIAAQLMPEPRGDAAEGLAPAEFHDPMLAAMLEDICLSEEAQTSLEVRIMAGLSEEQRERLSGLVVGPLMANADDAAR